MRLLVGGRQGRARVGGYGADQGLQDRARGAKLLPIEEIEEPTRIKIAGGDYGNFVVEITPRERDARNPVPAGITKRIKITAL